MAAPVTAGASQGSSRLRQAVRSLAQGVALALGEPNGAFSVSEAFTGTVPADDGVLPVAAVRVLGADALAPCTLHGRPLAAPDVVLVETALRAFPLRPNHSTVDQWLHWGLHRALADVVHTTAVGDQPDATWLLELPWPELSHQLGLLAALARPGAVAGPLAAAVACRCEDLARGFTRAVLRRDWWQAAGIARWLTLLGTPPWSLGLAAGLDFVAAAGRADPRTVLHVRAARLIRDGALR